MKSLCSRAGALLGIALTVANPRPASADGSIDFEDARRCPPPTLAQCQDNEFLETDPCGMLEADEDSTCSVLLQQAFETDTAHVPESVSVIAYEIEPLGVDNQVRKLPAEPLASYNPYYEPDLGLLSSQAASNNFGVADDIAVDIHAVWDANGSAVNDCREYAYEKYYDGNLYQRLIGTDQHDYRRAFDTAYGAGYNDAAIGTQHLSDPYLRGKDNRPYAETFSGPSRPKNAFFDFDPDPIVPGGQPVEDAPHLGLTLLYHFPPMLWVLGVAEANYGEVNETWAWHKEMSDALSVEGRDELDFAGTPPGESDPGPIDDWVDQPVPGTGTSDPLLAMTGAADESIAGDKPLRRYLDAELNEMFDLQEKLRELFLEWARLNEDYAGSGWTKFALDEEDEGDYVLPLTFDDIDRGAYERADWLVVNDNPVQPYFDARVAALRVEEPVAVDPMPLRGVGGLTSASSETADRRRVLDEIIALYTHAGELGCLDAGTTPCDWSPKLFMTQVLHDHSAEQDEDFAKCNTYFPILSFGQLENLNVAIIDEPASIDGAPNPLAGWDCRLITDSSLNAAELEQLMDDIDYCRSRVPLYKQAKAEHGALERMGAISELNDPATGSYLPAGIGDGASEMKGNDFFGLHYEWEYGFHANTPAHECDLHLYAGGRFESTAFVFSAEQNLVDALAEVRTDERSYEVRASILGIDLFTPIDQQFGANESIERHFSKTKSISKDATLISTTFFIGPVPVKLAAGVAGRAGVNLTLDAEAHGFGLAGNSESTCPSGDVYAAVEPFVGVEAFVSAGINVGVAEAGVRGNLVILQTALPFVADLSLAVDGSNGYGLSFPSNTLLDVNTSLDWSLTTLAGNLAVYGRLGVCPLCVKGEKPIVAWDGLRLDRNFYAQNYQVYLGDYVTAMNSQ